MELSERERRNLKRVYRLLADCTVLLKKDGRFPLEEAGRIALYGNGARHTVTGGTGSGEVNSRFTVSAERGLRAAGFTIATGAWMDAYDRVREQARADFLAALKTRAKEMHVPLFKAGMGAVMTEPEYDIPLDCGEPADAAVYVLSRIAGEGNDRVFEKGDILLTDTEVRDILALNRQYDRFMLVLNVGGPVDLSPVLEAGNILLLSQLGPLTGRVLADILLGKKIPSGKLAGTWASAAQQQPLDFGGMDETRYGEGIYAGYRYYDTFHKEVIFPFGYGLGWTDFSVSATGLRAEGSRAVVAAEVRNTGAFPGKEVAQVYVTLPGGSLDQPAQVLAGWKKTRLLAPGDTERLEIALQLRDIAAFDPAQAAYVLPAGDYILRLGTDSRSTEVIGSFTLPRTVRTRQVKDALGTPGFEDLRPDGPSGEAAAACSEEARFHVTLDPAAIATEIVSYKRETPVPEEVRALSVEELIRLNVGAHGKGGAFGGVIGSAAKSVAGAAGATAALPEKGYPELVMADGPAGLRLTPKYWKKDGEAYGISSGMPAGMDDLLPRAAKALMKLLAKKPPKNAEIREQYCTAIPIGTAVAQSFDAALAEACGDIVGGEMQEFGVHLWLAPALNLQRSIRCGRNFEYFSEDPLIGGYMAAALTRGVQAHPGCGVTLKHYAANNQETNRYQNNSLVSARAMRELYLRGFEIAVREGRPAAVMTSYNLLNGVHTSERRDLIGDILRCEFGFDGIVMTDWIIEMMNDKKAKYPAARPGKIAAAGGELVMPGSAGDVKAIVRELAKGDLTEEQLRINAARLLAAVRRLRG